MEALPPGIVNTLRVVDNQSRVLHVIVPKGTGASNEGVRATLWKAQLKQLGFARCIHDQCALSHLSVKGAETHTKTCLGFANKGDYVVCPACQARFKTFSTMDKHHTKTHGTPVHSVLRAESNIDDESDETLEKESSSNVVPHPKRAAPIPTTSEDTLETANDMTERIMAESRLISNPRPRGRPRKETIPESFDVSGLQYCDPFDMDQEVQAKESDSPDVVQYVQLHPMTEAFKKAAVHPRPAILRRYLDVQPEPAKKLNLDASFRRSLDPSSSDSGELVRMKTLDGTLVLVKKGALAFPQNQPDKNLALSPKLNAVDPKSIEDDLDAQEVNLANYQDFVVKVEHLAEQVSKMAYVERTNRLMKVEQDLKRREMEAKKRLVKAVSVIQNIKSGKSEIKTEQTNLVSAPEAVNTNVGTSEEAFEMEVVLSDKHQSIVIQEEEIFDVDGMSATTSDHTPEDDEEWSSEGSLEIHVLDVGEENEDTAKESESKVPDQKDESGLTSQTSSVSNRNVSVDSSDTNDDDSLERPTQDLVKPLPEEIQTSSTVASLDDEKIAKSPIGATSQPTIEGQNDCEENVEIASNESNLEQEIESQDKILVESSPKTKSDLKIVDCTKTKSPKSKYQNPKNCTKTLGPQIDCASPEEKSGSIKTSKEQLPSKDRVSTPGNKERRSLRNSGKSFCTEESDEAKTRSVPKRTKLSGTHSPIEQAEVGGPCPPVAVDSPKSGPVDKVVSEQDGLGVSDNNQLATMGKSLKLKKVLNNNSSPNSNEAKLKESLQPQATTIPGSSLAQNSPEDLDESLRDANVFITDTIGKKNGPYQPGVLYGKASDEHFETGLSGLIEHLKKDFSRKPRSTPVCTSKFEETVSQLGHKSQRERRRNTNFNDFVVTPLSNRRGRKPADPTAEKFEIQTPKSQTKGVERITRGTRSSPCEFTPKPDDETKAASHSTRGRRSTSKLIKDDEQNTPKTTKQINYEDTNTPNSTKQINKEDTITPKLSKQVIDEDAHSPRSSIAPEVDLNSAKLSADKEQDDSVHENSSVPKKRGRKKKSEIVAVATPPEPEPEKSPDSTNQDEESLPLKSRRGRKRKFDLTSSNDNTSTTTTPSKKSAANFVCGKCDSAFSVKKQFQSHVDSSHNGMARPKGESQEFSEAQMFEITRDVLTRSKSIFCYRCNTKTFTTMMGLKFHLVTCSKTEEELEAAKVKCEFCESRFFPHLLRPHILKHKRIVVAVEESDKSFVEGDEVTPGGRVKRKAASRASLKVANAIKQLKFMSEDGVEQEPSMLDSDNSEDEEYSEQNNPKISNMFVAARNPTNREMIYRCKHCDETFQKVVEIRKHVISVHAEQLEEDEDDDIEDDLEIDEDNLSERSCAEENLSEDDYVDADAGRKTVAAGYTFERVQKKNRLSHDALMSKLELQFRNKNFDKNFFGDFHSTLGDWSRLSNSEVESIKSKLTNSLKFETQLCLQTNETSSGVTTLPPFESVCQNNAITFFAGGPIWASAWCPLNKASSSQVIALSADLSFDCKATFFTTSGSLSTRPTSLIQMWTFTKGGSSNNNEVKFSAGLIHKYGRVRSLQWCPSGGQIANEGDCLPRLGLLAAGCEDSTVRIFPVSEFSALPKEENNLNFYSCDAVITLQRPDGGINRDGKIFPCVKVVWFRGCRHRVVAASFSDGTVGLWDLETTSTLLRPDKRTILPYKFFRAHQRNNLTFIDLAPTPDVDGFPTQIVTGSTDRMIATWDLGGASSDMPVREMRKFYVTDVAFLHHYQSHISVSFDDNCLQSNTRSAMIDFRYPDQTGNSPIVAQNSAIWSQCYSPLKNVIVSSTAGGEVVLLYLIHPTRSLQNYKDLPHCRVLIYRVDMGKHNHDPNPNKDGATYHQTLGDLENDEPLLKMRDLPIDNYKLANHDEAMQPKNPATMTPENPEIYPIPSINCVSISPNPNVTVLFSGGQSGLGRIHHLSNLDSKS